MLIPVYLLVFVFVLLVLEAAMVRHRVNRLALRIHVNGTRGKSSVTRYIAAGLRATGKRTLAKVTGVRPTVIRADGSTATINRRGGARVQEQVSMVHRSAQDSSECLVLECMSIRPDLQVFETQVLRPHISVLTNVLDDHQEELSDDPARQTEALCNAIGTGAAVITAPGPHLNTLRHAAMRRHARVVVTEPLTAGQRAQLPAGVFDVNVSLALTACTEAGIDATVAFPAILDEANAISEPASDQPDSAVRFVNGFAVNDIPSAKQFLTHWRGRCPDCAGLVIVFNTRSDRPLRSSTFAAYLPSIPDLIKVVVTGTHVPYMSRALKAAGLPSESLVEWSETQVRNAAAELLKLGVTRNHLVVGLGNIAGHGHVLAAALHGGPVHAV